MADLEHHTVILGGGSAGYAAAHTLAGGGRSVAVIEGGDAVGGLCILRGCMPTKALLHAASVRHTMAHGGRWGIAADAIRVDMERLLAEKDRLIEDFAGYRRQQLADGRFTFIRARARFVDPRTVVLDDGRTVTAEHFVVATGSRIAPLPLPALEALDCLTSDTALSLSRLPRRLVVLGAGAVGLEFAQYFARLGVGVTLLQRSPQLLKEADEDVATELEKGLRREGIQIHTGTRIVDAVRRGEEREIAFEQAGETLRVTADAVFHGLGRVPATDGLGLDEIGVRRGPGGHVLTDASQRSSVPHIFAAGDCAGPHEIVHIAIQQGETAARTILRPDPPTLMDYSLLTTVVFTDPAVAMTGLTERRARENGVEVRTATYPFNDHGKSMILGAQEGFVKLLADPVNGRLLGGACVGPEAGELIHEIVVALAARMTASQFAAIPHYHPTLAEIWTYPAEELAEAVAAG